LLLNTFRIFLFSDIGVPPDEKRVSTNQYIRFKRGVEKHRRWAQ